MKKRILIGLLTIGMIAQSLSVPVMAAPADAAQEETAEKLPYEITENQPDETPGEEPGESGDQSEKDQPDGTPGEQPGESGDQSEEGQPDETPGEQEGEPGEQPEEDQSGETPGESGEQPEESQSGETPEEQPDEDPSEQPAESEEEQSEEGTDELAEELPEEEADHPQPAATEVEYVDVADGVYQEGAFTVIGENANSDGSSYSIMSEAEASAATAAEEYVYKQLLAKKSSIDLTKYSISTSKIGALYSGVLNEHPDLYYVTGSVRLSYNPNTNIVTSITPTYISGLNDIAFQSGLNRALAVVKPGMTDLEKAVALHDYVVINCEYDYENYLANKIPQTSYSAYGVLANGTAVCQGYALAYKLLLNKVGIDCYMVTSGKEAMNHAWNLIVLGGEYYQVDTTWDDPTWDMIGRVVHTYMFRSDAEFLELDHYGWEVTSGSEVVDYKATDTRYDSAFWTDCRSPLVLREDGCYYIAYENSSACIKKKESLADNTITDSGTTVHNNIGNWPVWDKAGYVWSNAYSGLFQMDGRLYYNDKSSIYSIAPDGSDQRLEFKANTTNGYIYGSALSRGKVLYCLRQNPNFEGKETVLTADIAVSGEDDWDIDIMIQPPTVTTYKVGQKINLKGGKVTYMSGKGTKTSDLKSEMISGFDSTKPGICTVNVTCNGYKASFDTLIVEEPKLTAMYGQTLGEVAFPANDDGTYSWQDGTKILDTVSVQTYAATFTPNDESTFQQLTDLNVQVTVQTELGAGTDITFKNSKFIYNGTEQEPKVVVSVFDNVLTEGQDYTLSYRNNTDAGEAAVIIEGAGCYLGSVSRTFTIDPAILTITAKDKELLIGQSIPTGDEYEYELAGLVPGDELLTKPSFTCNVKYVESVESGKVAAAGRYDIIPHDADAGKNYHIDYKNGKLTVASEYASCLVTFDVQGHGTVAEDSIVTNVGSTIEAPVIEMPAEGYRFDGWYQDAACTKAWNFAADIVQSDITLFAKWLKVSEKDGFALHEIADVYYTGKTYKPAVSVYDVNSGQLLKAGKDYQIKYYNNTNANKDGALKKGSGTGEDFNPELPYVEITGKGNYTEAVKVNFNILKASIGDGSENPASGFTLKVSDQLATAKKAQKPFSSIKYVKGMKQGTDYTLSLAAVNARDQSGRSLAQGFALENASVPAGYEGEFLLTIQAAGNNYEGSIRKTIHVTDKSHLIKNAKITLGKNLKNIEYTGGKVTLTPSEENSADTFTVKYGSTFLRYNKDYTVGYRNNDRVGKAELIITGMGEYAGSKTVTFNIKGKSFTAKTVTIDSTKSIEDQVYTGKAQTQNGVALIYGQGTDQEEKLKYGTDYTISYSKNINKGTATMTFKGVDRAGYSGSFKKTFKITAQDLSQVVQAEGMQNITVGFTKAGAKPVDEIVLTNSVGTVLLNGKDYTLKYTNNKAVAKTTDEKPPMITVKGKGNYKGELFVYYNIIKSDLDWDIDGTNITVKASPVGYQQSKAADYEYKPSVKLMEGKTALRAGKDYEIEYVKNTQADYENYMRKLEEGPVASDDVDMPRAVITEKTDSNYSLGSAKIVPLPIYQTKLTKSNLTVTVGEVAYTGSQIKPEVTVYYQGESGAVKLTEHIDYEITSYGANITSGKNKGSVTISGIAPHYGGEMTVKFDIVRKPILY